MTLCFVLNEPGVRGRDDGLGNCFWSGSWPPGDASAFSFSLSSVQFSTLTVTTGCSSVEPSAEKVGSPTKFVALGKKSANESPLTWKDATDFTSFQQILSPGHQPLKGFMR